MYKIISIFLFSSFIFVSCSGTDSLDSQTKLVIETIMDDPEYSDWSEDDATCFAKGMKAALSDDMWNSFVVLSTKQENQDDVSMEDSLALFASMVTAAAGCDLDIMS